MINNSINSNIIEMFSSVQGEGPYIGHRQIFIRFALCNLNCSYCDTKFQPEHSCKIETLPGSGIFNKIKNPVNIPQLISMVKEFKNYNHHSLSLTGGEPLLNIEYISEFLKELKKENKLKIYLETNGTLPEQLEKIINLIDIISMDLKIETSTNTPAPWDKHNEFIKVSQKYNKEIFAKIVITKKISKNEIDKIIELIKNQQTEIPIIIQPVDSIDSNLVPDSNFLMNVQDSLLRELKDVRIIPQVHKYLNLI